MSGAAADEFKRCQLRDITVSEDATDELEHTSI